MTTRATSESAHVNVLSLGERTAGAVLHPYFGEGFSVNDNGSPFAKPLTHPLPEGEESRGVPSFEISYA